MFLTWITGKTFPIQWLEHDDVFFLAAIDALHKANNVKGKDKQYQDKVKAQRLDCGESSCHAGFHMLVTPL